MVSKSWVPSLTSSTIFYSMTLLWLGPLTQLDSQSRFHCSYTLLKCIGGRVYAAWHGATFVHLLYGALGEVCSGCIGIKKKTPGGSKVGAGYAVRVGASIRSSSCLTGETAGLLQILMLFCFLALAIIILK